MGNQRSFHRRGDLEPDRERRLEALEGWSWDILEAEWKEAFARLKQFVEREGHARVPQGAREDGYPLGRWIAKQRRPYGKGTLDPERRAQLEAMAGWTWDARDAAWEEGFAHLKRFFEREGHARVPRGAREEGYPLGRWVENQHGAHRKGTLDPQRRARLGGLRGWTWDAREAQWEEGFASLLTFVGREGHARVPRAHRENGHELGQWVLVQRRAYRKGTLGPQRRARLERLRGWTWDPLGDAWEEGFARLKRFVEREGHARVPQHYKEGAFRLGGWVFTQRQRGRGVLGEERAIRLESLAGWTWDPHQAGWDEKFVCLRKFVEREGHARVPKTHREDGIRLGSWVDNQRRLYIEKTLDPQRRARLEAQPGWDWAPYRTDWEQGLARLQCFVEREGSCRVPRSYQDDDGFGLGQWVQRQRGDYKDGRLSAARVKALEGVPGWS